MTMSSRTRKRRKPVAGVRPWAAVTLAVDPGDHCGCAIYDHGTYYDSGVGDGYDVEFIRKWIERGVFVADKRELPLVLVLEKPPAGGRPYKGTNRSPLGAASVIGCRKLWRRQWGRHADTVARYVVDVFPSSWRSAVLGTLINPQGRERLRAAVEKHNDATRAAKFSQDEAAAICIGVWASNAAEVAAVLPEKLRTCAS